MRFLYISIAFKICDFFILLILGSQVLATAKKLKGKLVEAFTEVKYCREEVSYTIEAQLAAYTQLACLKKVYIKVRLKEYYLVKQDLKELKADKQKVLNSIEAELQGVLVAYQLPLADFFIFNPSFLILPNLLNSNTPIPFFFSLFKFFSSFYIVLLYLVYLILYYLALSIS